jgi:hypothetical protein
MEDEFEAQLQEKRDSLKLKMNQLKDAQRELDHLRQSRARPGTRLLSLPITTVSAMV